MFKLLSITNNHFICSPHIFSCVTETNIEISWLVIEEKLEIVRKVTRSSVTKSKKAGLDHDIWKYFRSCLALTVSVLWGMDARTTTQ